MELNIEEFNNYDYELNNTFSFNNEHERFEEIPENTVPIKVIKKNVQFEEPMTSRENTYISRPKNIISKPQISYEDILSKMGMFVSEGKLHLLDDANHQPQKQQQQQPQKQQQQQPKPHLNPQQNVPPNSYIYNKYFKDEMQTQETIRKPTTKEEYRRMLLEDILQKQRIKQIKSTKLMMPTSNINLSSGNSANLNKLFYFPKR